MAESKSRATVFEYENLSSCSENLEEQKISPETNTKNPATDSVERFPESDKDDDDDEEADEGSEGIDEGFL